MNRQNILKTAIMLAATLLITACTNDETADSQPETLPEGMYPLTFTAAQADVVASPQTRVTDYDESGVHKSKWTEGDQIEVSIGNSTEIGLYSMNANGTIKIADKPVYWQTAASQTINAWYPANEIVDLKQQNSSLAYVMKSSVNGSYNSGDLKLSFQHQLAKVRVKVQVGYEVNLDNVSVSVLNYASCNNDKGTVVANENQTYIPTHTVTINGETYFEANVVPGQTPDDFIKIRLGNTDYYYKGSKIQLEAGCLHNFTVTVKMKEETIGSGEYTVKNGDFVVIKGNGKTTGNIKIEGTATVVLQNVNLENSSKRDYTPVRISNGTATIILEGENTIASTVNDGYAGSAIQLDNPQSHVVIKGTANSKLTVSAGGGHAAIGGRINSTCGNITIENATISASITKNAAKGAAAAIGAGSAWNINAGCGVVTIINSLITASVAETLNDGCKPAVIGTGGGDGYLNSCKGISITLMKGQSKSDFLNNLTGEYYVQVGDGQAKYGGSTSCGYVKWYNSDGSSVE